MQITRNTISTRTGPSDWFAGAVYVDWPDLDANHRIPCRIPPGILLKG
jgi:hypothetical protein